jgi:hypothetical protein
MSINHAGNSEHGRTTGLVSTDSSDTRAPEWRNGLAAYFEWADASEEARIEIEARQWRNAVAQAHKARRQAGTRKHFRAFRSP